MPLDNKIHDLLLPNEEKLILVILYLKWDY